MGGTRQANGKCKSGGARGATIGISCRKETTGESRSEARPRRLRATFRWARSSREPIERLRASYVESGEESQPVAVGTSVARTRCDQSMRGMLAVAYPSADSERSPSERG